MEIFLCELGHREDPMDLGNFSQPPHPQQFFKEDKGDIQDFVLDWAFSWEKWKFSFVNLGTGRTLWIWEIFPNHPIPNNFSRKIREIFKISCWIGHFRGRNGNFPL